MRRNADCNDDLFGDRVLVGEQHLAEVASHLIHTAWLEVLDLEAFKVRLRNCPDDPNAHRSRICGNR